MGSKPDAINLVLYVVPLHIHFETFFWNCSNLDRSFWFGDQTWDP